MTIPLGVLASARAVALSSESNPYANAVLDDAPLAYWRLGDADKSYLAQVTDSTSNNRHSIYQPGVSSVVGRIAGSSAAQGPTNGISKSVGAAWMESLAALTIEFWFKTSDSGTFALVTRSNVTSFGSTDGHAYRTYISGGTLVWQVFAPDFTPRFTIQTGGNYADGAWHHVVARWNGTTGAADILIDLGTAGTAGGSTGLSPNAHGLGLNIGWFDNSSSPFYFPGVIDEVAIYDKVLSDTRVSDHFTLAV